MPQGRQINIFPSARIGGEITPEYMGVGYIIGPKIAGVLVAGGILSWFVFIPLLASLINPDHDCSTISQTWIFSRYY